MDIYTMGFTQKTAEQFFEKIKKNEIEILVDSFCKSAYLVVSIGTPYNNKYYKFVAKIFVTEDD